jgi:bacillithiol system protein YtxJ
MATIQEITAIDTWNALWSELEKPESAPCLVLKHSPRCPTSHFVERVFRKWAKDLDAGTLRIVAVDVVNARPISQKIAADTNVRHESPQALLIGGGQRILWNDSHEALTSENLEASLAKLHA